MASLEQLRQQLKYAWGFSKFFLAKLREREILPVRVILVEFSGCR